MRFEVLYKVEENWGSPGCPVAVVSHALTKDTQTDGVIAQCKFVNLTDDIISALFVKIDCMGVDGEMLQGVSSFPYLDLSVAPNIVFGGDVGIPLPDKTTRCYTITIEKVVFAQGEAVAANENTRALTQIETGPSFETLGVYKDTYFRALEKDMEDFSQQKHLACEGMGYWVCGCGAINSKNAETCRGCGASHGFLIGLSRQDRLEELERDHQEEKRLRHIEEQKEQEHKLEMQQKEKKNSIVFAIVIGILIVAFVIVFITVIYPYQKSQTNLGVTSTGEYEVATTAFP